MKNFQLVFLVVSIFCAMSSPYAQITNSKYKPLDKFRQLDESLPTPNVYRTASGAPGHKYWQQRADYVINVEIDDKKQRLIGKEKISYTNHSPDILSYLWVQLDNNIFAPDSDTVLTQTSGSLSGEVRFASLRQALARREFDGSVKITAVNDAFDLPLEYHIVKTMMRIDLKKPLKPGETTIFSIDWSYNINNSRLVGGRTGYEYFKEDGNYIYEIAHWYPRMAAYTDVHGWQHKQFLGRGEFTLEFGDYLVRVTVPDDHIVSATGVLQNAKKVLTKEQRERFNEAKTAKNPMFIVTPEEAKNNEKTKPSGKKTWIFKAENIRDFAFATSRKFIWDAQGHNVEDNHVMAMSFYPNEGEPLWSKYSTHSIIHTLDVYSRYTFKYPYPVAISVNGPIFGMEYPMICFNGPRPKKDGTYSKRTKYALISVIIHEVGHNYFPMIVNSDERRWTWMDEGLNTFLQYLSEQEWEENYPSRRGEPRNITSYMSSSAQVPIMTHSQSILQFGPNAYGKPATALNILRETVMGRKLFDKAFKEYAQRWMFKRPTPADFFRTMEDASGIDLDWFWRGWFYSTDHTDISIEDVRVYNVDTQNPEIENKLKQDKRDNAPESLSKKRNKSLLQRANIYPELKDFYNTYNSLDVTASDLKTFEKFFGKLKEEERKLMETKYNFYQVTFKNIGGLVMPVILEINYEDGSKEELRIPAEIWRQNSVKAKKTIVTEKKITSLSLDPHLETADTDMHNNHYPRRIRESRFKLFNRKRPKNPMQKKKIAEEEKKKEEEEKKKEKEEDK